MTPGEAIRVIAPLQAAWPSEAWPRATIELWARLLGPYPYRAALAAAEVCVTTMKFRPAPAEFLEQLRREAGRLVHRPSCRCEGTGWVGVQPPQPDRPNAVVACPEPGEWVRDDAPATLGPGPAGPVRQLLDRLAGRSIERSRAALEVEPDRRRPPPGPAFVLPRYDQTYFEPDPADGDGDLSEREL